MPELTTTRLEIEMNENAPTLPPNAPQQMAAQPQPLSFDFSEGDSKQVMQGSGPTFQPGTYWWTLTKVEYRQSKDPQKSGAMLAIIEGVITKNLSADGTGESPGVTRACVLVKSNEFGFYPTIRKFLACLQEISDPNQTRTNSFNDVLNNPATYAGVTLKTRVTQKMSRANRPYNIFDWDGIVSDAEVDAHFATNPELDLLARPSGSRAAQGLGSPSQYFVTK